MEDEFPPNLWQLPLICGPQRHQIVYGEAWDHVFATLFSTTVVDNKTTLLYYCPYCGQYIQDYPEPNIWQGNSGPADIDED